MGRNKGLKKVPAQCNGQVTISRDEFLTSRLLAISSGRLQSRDPYGLRSERVEESLATQHECLGNSDVEATISCDESLATQHECHGSEAPSQPPPGLSPVSKPSQPPPGLTPVLGSAKPPPGLEGFTPRSSGEPSDQDSEAALSDVSSSGTKAYNVLLENLPENMMGGRMLQAMCTRAQITDIVDMTFRGNGKASITFGSYAQAHQSIIHFHGRRLRSSKEPIIALYVHEETSAVHNGVLAKAQTTCTDAPVCKGEVTEQPPEKTCSRNGEKEGADPGASASEAKQYKVLLSNLPDHLLKECVLRDMLEQAKLRDCVQIRIHKSAKALITFSSYTSVHHCIVYFSGFNNLSSQLPIIAVYVYTKPPQKTAATNQLPATHPYAVDAPVFVPAASQMGFDQLPATHPCAVDAPVFIPSAAQMAKPMSGDAPEFIPTAMQVASTLSADAPTFIPASELMMGGSASNASTGAGATSDTASPSLGCASEPDSPIDCA